MKKKVTHPSSVATGGWTAGRRAASRADQKCRRKRAWRDFSKLWQEQPWTQHSYVYLGDLQPVLAILGSI